MMGRLIVVLVCDRQGMRGYAKYRRVFSRTGKASGGVPGLDQPGRPGGAAGIQP